MRMPGAGISVVITAGAAAGLCAGTGVSMASRVVTRFVSSFAGTLLLLQAPTALLHVPCRP